MTTQINNKMKKKIKDEHGLIKRLHCISENLSVDPKNPAYISNGELKVNVSPDEYDEVISLIGKWSYEKRKKERCKLNKEKESIIRDLFPW